MLWTLVVLSMVPAGALTIARASGSDTTLVLQLVAFTPYATALYLIALVLLAIGGLTTTKETGAWVAVAVFAAGGFSYHFYLLAPAISGTTPSVEDESSALVVMTANLAAGSGDAGELVDLAVSDEVDVLVVQEITPRALRDMQRVGLETTLPFSVGEPAQDFDGTMVFADRPLSLRKEIDTTHDSLVVDAEGLRLFGLHPGPPLEGQDWVRDHEAIREAVGDFDPDLMIGDFNATNDHEPMRDLAELGYTDAVQLTNGWIRPTWPADRGLIPALVAIDHVLVSPEWTVSSVETRDLSGTDHRPVVATVGRR